MLSFISLPSSSQLISSLSLLSSSISSSPLSSSLRCSIIQQSSKIKIYNSGEINIFDYIGLSIHDYSTSNDYIADTNARVRVIGNRDVRDGSKRIVDNKVIISKDSKMMNKNMNFDSKVLTSEAVDSRGMISNDNDEVMIKRITHVDKRCLDDDDGTAVTSINDVGNDDDDNDGCSDKLNEMKRILSIIFYQDSRDIDDKDICGNDGDIHRSSRSYGNNVHILTSNNNNSKITLDYNHSDYWIALINHSEEARVLFLQHLDERRSDGMLLSKESYLVMCVAMKVKKLLRVLLLKYHHACYYSYHHHCQL